MVTLAFSSAEVLTYPIADPKDFQSPCSIQSLSVTPELAAKVAPTHLMEWGPNFSFGKPTSSKAFSMSFLRVLYEIGVLP